MRFVVRVLRAAAVLALALLLPGMALSARPVLADDVNTPSAAGVTAAVIAHGVAAMPAATIAWRVVQDTAEPLGQATFEQRALGFAVATNDALLLTDQATGARDRLAAREATFTADQTVQRRESLGPGATPYDRIALVPAAKANDAGGDTFVFGGDPFPAPGGDRALSLVKGNLYATGHDDGFQTDVPLLVLVLQGTIAVSTDGGANATLAAGQAGSFAGTVGLHSLVATGAGSTYVAAVIGPAMPQAGAAAAPAPSASTGGVLQIDFSVDVCPPDDGPSQKRPGAAGFACLQPDGTAEEARPLTGAQVVLTNADTGEKISDQAGDDGRVSFVDLAAGAYRAVVTNASGQRSFCIGIAAGDQTPVELGDIVDSATGLALEAGWKVHCVVDSLAG